MRISASDIATTRAGRADPPESGRQAQRWDATSSGYARAGLCTPCASRGAWGMQLGYSRVSPPCERCATVLSDLGGEASLNGWSSLPETEHEPVSGKRLETA